MQKPGLFGMNGFMVFLLNCFSFAAHAQQPGYLILIDAENKQAFTVRIGDQFYTSSGHGHVVLSHLKDSSYHLNLRFSKNNSEEQVFPVVIHQKDLGFQLKGAEGSWSLYNWQTKETIRPIMVRDSSRILDMGVKREDGFSQLMASVVNDSSVMYNTYTGNGFNRDSLKTPTDSALAKAANVQRPTAFAKASAVKDRQLSTTFATGQAGKAVVGQPSTVNRQLSTTSVTASAVKDRQPSSTFTPGIKKLRDVSLKVSRKITFLDVGKDGLTDTITLFVYFEGADTALKQQAVEPVLAIKKISKPDSAGMSATHTKNKPVLKAIVAVCSQSATENDVQSLRDAILKANTDQDKILVASGAFSLKCFSVSQIRLLAGLLVSDKSKYRLMDAAHLHITDYDHFRELVDMLTDKNFQRKFLVMAEKRS
jgi:Domain of unknown function (DUF4476)